MLGDGGVEPAGVPGHRDDVEAEPLQQPGQALPQQDPVLGQDYPDRGCLLLVLVARNLHAQDGRAAGRAGQQHPAAGHGHPVGQAGQAGAAGGVGAAAAVVADLQHQDAAAGPGGHAGAGRPAVLGDVGERLGRREVGRVLDLARQPPGQGGVDRHGDRCLVGELAERRRQPEVGQDLRLDAVDQLPQLGHQLLGLLVRGGHGLRGGRPGRQVEPGQAELHGERDQLLLGAVVQVTLDAAALGLEGVGQPGTGRRDLGQLGAQPLLRPAAAQQRAGDRRVRPGDQRHQVRAQAQQDEAGEDERHRLRHGRGLPGEHLNGTPAQR